MKRISRKLIVISAVVAASILTCPVRAAAPAGGLVDFGTFEPSASGGEFVEINLKSNLISLAAKLAEKQEPEAAALLRSVQSVRVNVIGLDSDNRADLEERVKHIRADLDAKGWERVVTVKKDKEDVAVYLKTRGDESIEGLVVTVLSERKEAVFVNVAGNIKPEQLASLGEALNIEPLKKAGHKMKKP